MSLDHAQVRVFVVRPALERIGFWSQASENLVFGTGLHESHYIYLDQIGSTPGPAYGLWQIEEATYEDIWRTISEDVRQKLRDNFCGVQPSVSELHGNLFLGAAMCRLLYRRIKEPLPHERDVLGMARYWKRYYNTSLGKGSVEVAMKSFEVACHGY